MVAIFSFFKFSFLLLLKKSFWAISLGHFHRSPVGLNTSNHIFILIFSRLLSLYKAFELSQFSSKCCLNPKHLKPCKLHFHTVMFAFAGWDLVIGAIFSHILASLVWQIALFFKEVAMVNFFADFVERAGQIWPHGMITRLNIWAISSMFFASWFLIIASTCPLIFG